MRRGSRAMVVAVVAVGLVLAWVAPAAAECQGPFPSFREVAPSARTLVIGDVVAVRGGGLTAPSGDDGRSSRFTLRVRHVVRGTAEDSIRIDDLTTQPCASVLVARRGDRIALAMGGMAFDPPIAVNTAAWIVGTPPFAEIDAASAMEATTTDAVFALAGIDDPPSTDTSTPSAPADPEGPASFDPWPWVELLLVAGGVAFLVLSRREQT